MHTIRSLKRHVLFIHIIVSALLLSSTNTSTSLFAQPTYVDWTQWYPLYFGQQGGQRAINWWGNGADVSNTNASKILRGQSIYRYANGFYDLPPRDYYHVWPCSDYTSDVYDPDPDCKKMLSRWTELLSISGVSGENLEQWASGPQHAWTVYYSTSVDAPDALKRCDVEAIKNMSETDRSSPTYKAPLLFNLSSTNGEVIDSPIVCGVTIKNYSYAKENILSARYAMVRVTRKETQDEGNVIYTSNEYFADSQGGGCRSTALGSPANTITKTYSRGDLMLCTTSYEEYYMRKVGAPEPDFPDKSNPIRTNGMGAWQYWPNMSQALTMAYDKNGQYWDIESMPLEYENGWVNWTSSYREQTSSKYHVYLPCLLKT